MSASGILSAAILIGGIGLLVGIFLGIAAIVFKVHVDEREEKIQAVLPGNNCGGCGYPGCSGLAAAIAKGDAAVNSCPVGGDPVAKQVAAIMGVEEAAGRKMVAFVHCAGDCEKTHPEYDYYGVRECTMMSFVPDGGPKSCNFGCLGYGTCVKACPFGAIKVVDGLARIDKEQCKACGKCVAACPKHLISLEPYDAKCLVACSNGDKGPLTMRACKTGCIGCGICAKNCPTGAITVNNFHASIDQEKCDGCGLCAEKCPKHIIVRE